MAVITIITISLALALVISVINNEANYSVDTIQYLQSVSQKPLIYETWHNGVIQLATNRPFEISHIILPNGQIINKSILVQNTIPLGNILVGNASWAIIVTNEGTWYNVTHLTDQLYTQIDPEGLYYGIPWNSTVLQNVGLDPNFYVTQGIKMLNFTATKINANAGIYNQVYGVTDVLAVTYPSNVTNGWVNITYYAPVQSTGNVPNPYFWNYYYNLIGNNINPAYNPFNYPYYYLLITTNPYAWTMNPIWYSAIYSTATVNSVTSSDGMETNQYETNFINPQGAINFTYNYINATMGVYVPIYNESNGNIGYLYIPITVFEITNVMAYVPSAVWGGNSSSGPPTDFGSGTITNPPNITGAQWVPLGYSWVVAPLEYTPYLGNGIYPIKKAYDPNNIPGPTFIDFPASSYTGFPSYYGINYTYLLIHQYALNYTPNIQYINVNGHGIPNILVYIPSLQGGWYTTLLGLVPPYPQANDSIVIPAIQYNPTYWKIAKGGNPDNLVTTAQVGYNAYARPNVQWGNSQTTIYADTSWSVALLNQTNDPITMYRLAMNMYTGQVLLYGLDPNTGNWILLMNMLLSWPPGQSSGFEFIHYLPIYITAPYGTYLLGAAATGEKPQNVYHPPNG